MGKRFVLHPTKYAVRQTEEFYAEMAQKGWVLEKRGENLSRFRREAPQKTVYRVELSGPAPCGEDNPPLKLVASYEAAGWTLVTCKGFLCIFSAPAGSSLPEIPDDPLCKAAVQREMRKNAVAGLVVIALAVFGLVMAAPRGLLSEITLAWYTDTAEVLLAGTAAALLLFDTVDDALHAAVFYGALRRGAPVAGGSFGNGGFRRTVVWALMTFCLIFALLSGSQYLSTERHDMPVEANGPYILLSELGFSGKRIYFSARDNVSSVTYTRSLLSEQWHTREFVEERKNGPVCSMWQQVYRLKSPEDAMAIVAPLMSESIFARGEGKYAKVEVPGLDGAWESALEYIAVKDSTVYYIICIDSTAGTPAGPKVNIPVTLAKILNYRQNS